MKKYLIVGLALSAAVAMGAPRPVWAEHDGSGGGSEKHEKHHLAYGKFTAVNAQTGSVTIENKHGETTTVTVGANATIKVNGKAGALADVQVGMYGGVKMDENGTVLELRANDGGGDKGGKHQVFSGKVTAVNAQAGSITFTNGKTNESKTFTVAGDTKIQVNGKDGTLADVQVDMYGGAKTDETGKVLMVQAKGGGDYHKQ